LRVYGEFIIEWLTIEIVFFIFVYEDKRKIMLLWIFNVDDIILLSAIFKLKRIEFKMIGKKNEIYLSEPNSINYDVLFIFQSYIENYSSFDCFPTFE